MNDLNYYRNLVLQAIFKDESVKELLLVKGGQLLNIFGISDRTSFDLDLAIKESQEVVVQLISEKIEKNLRHLLSEQELFLLDYQLHAKPKIRHKNHPPYWGGYEISFKIIPFEKKEEIYSQHLEPEKRLDLLRKTSLPIGGKQSTKMKIDLSYHEYTGASQNVYLEDGEVTIQTYRPLIFVYEKMRALCQNMPGSHLPSNKSNRARDLFDIYKIVYSDTDYSCTEFEITDEFNIKELKKVFQSKHVPLALLLNLETSKENLKHDFETILIQTAPEAEEIGFEFLYNFTDDLMKRCYQLLSSSDIG